MLRNSASTKTIWEKHVSRMDEASTETGLRWSQDQKQNQDLDRALDQRICLHLSCSSLFFLFSERLDSHRLQLLHH